MAKLKLTFAHDGHQPGDVIDVLEQDVLSLIRGGIGHLEGAVPRLRLGHLPEVAQPVPDAPVAVQAPPQPTSPPEPTPQPEDAAPAE